METEFALLLEDVSFAFNKGKPNEVNALKGVNLGIKKGSIVVISGVSGSGKTTLLNILDLLLLPQKGSYKVLGEDASSLSESERAKIRANKIGYVFQDFALLNKERVKNNLELPLLFSDKYKKKKDRDHRIDELLLNLGISDKKKEKVFRLSGGQRQRLAIARALVNDPEIILADEPTTSLDKGNKEKVIEIFKELNKQGKTVIIVTHDVEVAKAFEDNYSLVDGQISKLSSLILEL